MVGPDPSLASPRGFEAQNDDRARCTGAVVAGLSGRSGGDGDRRAASYVHREGSGVSPTGPERSRLEALKDQALEAGSELSLASQTEVSIEPEATKDD